MPADCPDLGISAIAIHEPQRKLGNQWFGANISRKFTQHTGTESRGISADDEVTMGVRVVEKLWQETSCKLGDCAGVVFVSPSFVPQSMARKYLAPRLWKHERLSWAAANLTEQLGIAGCPAYGINWYCSGYARAVALLQHHIVPALDLRKEQFVLVVTAGRISRITDYACAQTAPLFGDMATATLLARVDSDKYPVHFKLKASFAEKQPAEGAFFDFALRQNVLCPGDQDSRDQVAERVVYTLDGLGIADVAPRAMASAVAKVAETKGLPPESIRFVVPHQAGTAIVRFTGMKLEQAGVRGEVINGITAAVGNVSSNSIPFALKQTWSKLRGIIACPTAAVGAPGEAEVSRGCVLLEASDN